MSGCDYFEQLCAVSIDGTLTAEEQEALEAHLMECPDCAALYGDLHAMDALLHTDAPVPADIHERIMERVRAESKTKVVQPVKPMRRLPVFTMLAAAAVVALVALGGGLAPFFNNITNGASTASTSGAAQSDTDAASAPESTEDAIGSSGAGARISGSSARIYNDADAGDAAYNKASDSASAEEGAIYDFDDVQTDESLKLADLPSLAESTLELPESLVGSTAAHCYLAVGRGELPDIEGDLLVTEDGTSYFSLENNMSVLEKTLRDLEEAGYTVTPYENVGLVSDPKANTWLLIVQTV